MIRAFLLLVFISSSNIISSFSQQNKKTISTAPLQQDSVELLLRCDDVGMCHAVNMATEQLIETGIPFSASVMFACPWYQEAVEILKKHPHISVGVHLTLGAEWKSYRWGPITSPDAVPSLVDSLGYFHATPAIHLAHHPKTDEVEREFRAQIERALDSGLQIDYLDNHMGAGLYNPEQRAVLEKLAKEYKLGISRYYNEDNIAVPVNYPFEMQIDTLISTIQKLEPGNVKLMVFHLGLETPEMNALQDINASGVKQMSRQRHTELNMLISPRFKEAIQTNRIKLITYRDLVSKQQKK